MRRGLPQMLDRLSDDAPEDNVSRWGGGVITPLIPLSAGVIAIVCQRAYFVGMRPARIAEYGGKDAIALGLAAVAVGMLLHGHYFWAASDRFYFVSEILKPLSLLLLAGAMGFVVVNQFLFM